jgi:hypothetical protein
MHSSLRSSMPSLRLRIGWWVTALGAVIWGITMLVSVTPRALGELDQRQQLARHGVVTTGTVVAHQIHRGTRNCDSSTTVRYLVEATAYDLQLRGGCNVSEQLIGASAQVTYLAADPSIAQASVGGGESKHRFNRLRLIFLWVVVGYLALLSRYLWTIPTRNSGYWFAPFRDRRKWWQPRYRQGLIFAVLHLSVLFAGLACLGGQASIQHVIYFVVFFFGWLRAY